MRGFAVVLIAFLLLPVAGLLAQEAPSLEPGVRVRMTAPHCNAISKKGRLQEMRGDTLVLDTIECPLENAWKLEVSRGRKRSVGRVLAGASLGILGGLLGAAVGYALEHDRCHDTCGIAPAIGGIVGAGGGVVIGTVIGALIRTDRWEEVPLNHLRVSLALQRDGRFALGVTLRC